MQRYYTAMIKKALAIAFLLALWKACALALQVNILPPPKSVAVSCWNNMGLISLHTAFSMLRLFGGIAAAILAGAPIGILFGYFRKLDDVVSPLIYLLAPMPKIAFLPLIMLFFGINDPAKVFIVFIVMVFLVIITLRDAVKKIPEELYFPFLAAKKGPVFIITNIVIPAAAPEVFTAIRLGLATGISVLFIAETFGTVRGLGFYIMDMWMRVDYPAMYSGIIMMGVMGYLCAVIVDFLQARLCPWKR